MSDQTTSDTCACQSCREKRLETIKAERAHAWRMAHPKAFLIENFCDWGVAALIVLIIACAAMHGCDVVYGKDQHEVHSD